ncbi:MAG: glycosyltransferase family 4 protein [Deltaproteobacteria bacterium]|nr:glycosyltransferase family 4 protein [Deltaproteobacteria bacterium]
MLSRVNRPILNYLAAGLPMVSFRGSAEFMAHRPDAAVLVPGGDWRDLAAGLLKVLQDRDFARELGRRGRQFIVEEYDCLAACRKLLGVYHRLAPEN